MTFAQIAIPAPLHQPFTYRISEALQGKIKAGMRIKVPFRKKEVTGFCMGLTANLPKGFSEEELKEISALPDASPVFSDKMLQLIEWLSDYYMAPIGEVCRSALPEKMFSKPKLKEEEHSAFHEPEVLSLNSEQKGALERLIALYHSKTFQPVLLQGVTGSGKTEVYLQFVKEILKQGKQAIFLVPEISLTPQLIGRVQSRLNTEVAIYHSGLSSAWRYTYWEQMRQGKVQVVVGTRSALFAPFPNLGAIIVDEEQDPSYKQGEGSFHYHARDAAIMRAKLENAVVVLNV